MKHIDFLKEILMSEWEYWVVARMQYVNEYGKMKRIDDDILIIAIPYNVRRGLAYENIMLTDLEKLSRVELNNIFITRNFPPFQQGVTMYDIYVGYPIKKNIHEFMVNALSLKTKNIYDYKALLNNDQEVQVCDATEVK